MPSRLANKYVAILATNGVEPNELAKPMKGLRNEGAEVTLVSLQKGKITAAHTEETFKVDKEISEVSSEDFDALVLPGGVANPDKLRMNKEAVAFVKDFMNAGKPVGAICHGPWMLVEADAVRDLTLTSYASIKTDIVNAGGKWVDKEVVVDKGLVTSRTPDDLPAFCKKLIEEIAEGKHAKRAA